MQVSEIFKPSDVIEEQAAQLAAESGQPVDSTALMRDYRGQEQDPDTGELAVVVGDMANALAGNSYRLPELANRHGLPEDYPLRSGLLGSMALRKALPPLRTTGQDFVADANGALRKMYAGIGLVESASDLDNMASVDRTVLSTGYVGQVLVGPKITTITNVGDVMTWVNGKPVAGMFEKPIDTEQGQLTTEVTKLLSLSGLNRAAKIIDKIRAFGEETGLPEEEQGAMFEEIMAAITDAEQLDDQTAYGPIDRNVTLWQIPALQNPTPGTATSKYHYGAIDGSHTPDRFIDIIQYPNSEIDSIVVATDGLRPVHPNRPVHSLEDLAPTNKRFGEQTAVQITDIQNVG